MKRPVRQPLHTKNKSGKKKWLLLGIVLLVLLGGTTVFFTSQKAPAFDCITAQHTNCPDDVVIHFSPLSSTPRWRVQKRFEELKGEAIEKFPDVTDVQLAWEVNGGILLTVEEASVIFPAFIENTHWQVLTNGTLIPLKEPALPLFEFPSKDFLAQASSEERQKYADFYHKLRGFSPRFRKFVVQSPDLIEAYPENGNKIFFTTRDLDRQTSTLQAFFRSSTMNHDYQALDLRFQDVIVIKEE